MTKLSIKLFLLILAITIQVSSMEGAQKSQNYFDFLGQLISGNDSTQAESLKKLLQEKDPATFPLLSAINDKKFFLYETVPVTTGEKFISNNGTELFPIYKLYPKYELYKNENGEVLAVEQSKLSPVEISRSNRLLIAPLIPYLNLVSLIPEKRKLAYSQFQGADDAQIIPLLRKSLNTENEKDVLRLGKETVFSIILKTSKDEVTIKMAIDSLEENWGPNTESILYEYGNVPPTTNMKDYATKASGRLQKKHEVVAVAQNLFSGLSLGSILILIALGLSIIYGIAGVINMAHGEFLMIGAYTTFAIQEIFPKNSDTFFLVSLPVSFLVAGIFGFIIERLIIRFLYSRPLESLLATWGVSLVLVQMARSVFGDLTAVRAPRWLSGGWEIMPHLILPYNRLFIIGISIFIISITYLTLYKSRLGMLIRAVTQNRNMSSCLGIETRKVDMITFFLGSGLAGIAGCAMTLIGNVVPDMGQTYIVDSFLVVVTGGVGKMAGAIISGFGIGFLTKFMESLFEAVYGKVFILVIIIMFLQFKPKGMFPDKGRIGDD